MEKIGRPKSIALGPEDILSLDKIYTRKDIAKYLHCSVSTVNRYIRHARDYVNASLITEERSDDNETKSS